MCRYATGFSQRLGQLHTHLNNSAMQSQWDVEMLQNRKHVLFIKSMFICALNPLNQKHLFELIFFFRKLCFLNKLLICVMRLKTNANIQG